MLEIHSIIGILFLHLVTGNPLCPYDGLKYPSDVCNGYFECEGGQFKRVDCNPSNYHYNCEKRICEDIEHCCAVTPSTSSSTKTVTNSTTVRTTEQSKDTESSPTNSVSTKSETSTVSDKLSSNTEPGNTNSPSCPKDGNSVPYAGDCSKYWQCSKGQLIEKSCPTFQSYNCITKSCTFTVFSPCCKNGTSNNGVFCPIPGMKIPNPFTCNKYFECKDFKIAEIECPKSEKYDWFGGKCVAANSGECGVPKNPPTVPTPNSKCPKEGDVIPYPGDCNSYLECNNKKLIKKSCKSGESYDCIAQRCSSLSLFHGCCKNNSGIEEGVYCWNLGVKFPNPFTCNKYYECVNNKIKQQTCSSGNKYDWFKQKCVKDKTGSCGLDIGGGGGGTGGVTSEGPNQNNGGSSSGSSPSPGSPGEEGSSPSPGSPGEGGSSPSSGSPGEGGSSPSPGNPGEGGSSPSPGNPGEEGSSPSPGNPGEEGSSPSPGSPGEGGSSPSPGSPGEGGSSPSPGNPGEGGSSPSPGNPGEEGSSPSPGNPGEEGSSPSPGSPGEGGSSPSPGSPGEGGSSPSPGNPGEGGSSPSPGNPGEEGSSPSPGSPGDGGSSPSPGSPGEGGSSPSPGSPGDGGSSPSPGSPGEGGSSPSPGSPGEEGSSPSPGNPGEEGSSPSPGSPGEGGSSPSPGSPGEGGSSPSPGSPGEGGSSPSPGNPGEGGSSPSPGNPGEEGSSPSPGNPGEGGSSPSPGNPGEEGLSPSPGSPGEGGSSPSPGNPGEEGSSPSPGSPGDGGSSPSPGSPGEGGSSPSPGNPSEGGSSPSPGSPGEEGSSPSPGNPGEEGSSPSPGSPGEGGLSPSPGSPGEGGSSPSPGNPGEGGSSPSPGNPGEGGSSPSPGNPGEEGSSPSPGNPGEGDSSPSPGNPGEEGLSPSPGSPGEGGSSPSPGNPGEEGSSPSPGNPGEGGLSPSPGSPGGGGLSPGSRLTTENPSKEGSSPIPEGPGEDGSLDNGGLIGGNISITIPSTCDIIDFKLPDVNDCRSYYKCTDGKFVKQTCPAGSSYNCFLKSCKKNHFSYCCPRDKNISSNSGSDKCLIKGLKLPNPFTCNKYFECVNGRIVQENCSAGEKYDWLKGKCTEASKGRCAPTLDLGSSSNSSSGIEIGGNVTVTLPSSCNIFSIKLPDIKNCNSYYQCKHGQYEKKSCPEGKQYNCFLQSCSKQQSSFCCPNDPNQSPNTGSLSCLINDLKVPNPFTCNKYFKCDKLKIVQESCPEGTKYDWIKMKCVDSKSAKCARGFTISNGGNSSSNYSENNPLQYKCKHDEKVSDPNDCNAYYKCHKGQFERKVCEFGLKYDCWLKVCSFVDNKHCCNKSVENSGEENGCVRLGLKNPDILNCKNYYECSGFKTKLKSCSPNQEFDVSTLSCKPDKKSLCINQLGNSPTSPSPLPSCDTPNSKIPDKDDCSSYYTCDANRQLQKNKCPNGLVWNCAAHICTQKTFKSCCKNDKNITSEHLGHYCLMNGSTLPNPFSCSKYYLCEYNILVNKSCGPGERYELVTEKCGTDKNKKCATDFEGNSSSITTEGTGSSKKPSTSNDYDSSSGAPNTPPLPDTPSVPELPTTSKSSQDTGSPNTPTTLSSSSSSATLKPSILCPIDGLKYPSTTPKDCGGYLECINRQIVKKECSKGLTYNCEKRSCEFQLIPHCCAGAGVKT